MDLEVVIALRAVYTPLDEREPPCLFGDAYAGSLYLSRAVERVVCDWLAPWFLRISRFCTARRS